VTTIEAVIAINLVTPKAAAKPKLLFTNWPLLVASRNTITGYFSISKTEFKTAVLSMIKIPFTVHKLYNNACS